MLQKSTVRSVGPIYPDVSNAIKSGKTESARTHFMSDGYFEGRLPSRFVVDQEWYLTQYPEAVSDIRNGLASSVQTHFELIGYAKGWLPFNTD
jgi:hypothetical protein